MLASEFAYIDDEVFGRMCMEEVNDKMEIIYKKMTDQDEADYINSLGHVKTPKMKHTAQDCFDRCFPAEKQYLTPERLQRAMNGG